MWDELLQVIEVSESWVRHWGIYRGVHRDLKEHLASVARTPRTQQVSAHLVAFVAEESLKASPYERLVGSSEVLESVFGKLKRFNWLRVLDTAEGAQIDHRVPQQLHAIVALLDTFEAEQQPLKFVLPCKRPLDPHA